jgi:hypothetical protein
MMMILNLTQHPATSEQIASGIVNLSDDYGTRLRGLLTFATLPSSNEVLAVARAIADLADEVYDHEEDQFPRKAMIGGVPFLMARLEAALRGKNIDPVYAFSVRESEEQVQADGSVRKVNVFRHIGFVDAS